FGHERDRPVQLAGLGIEAVNRLGMPDEKLSRAASLDDRGRGVPRLAGLERVPELFAGIFVEGVGDPVFAAHDADELLAVNQRMAAETPDGCLRFEVAFEVLRPENCSFGGIETEEIALGSQSVNLAAGDRPR